MLKSGVVFIVAALLLASVAMADDLEDQPFALRLLLALERANNNADTLGLQAAAADPSGASMNPAGDARRDKWGPDATVSWVNALSTSGAWFSALFGHASFTPGENDRLAFAYAYTATLDGSAHHQFEDTFGSDELYLRYSFPLSEATTLGGELRYIFAHVQEESISDGLPFPTRKKTSISGPDLTLGVQSVLSEAFSVGFLAGAGVQWTKTRVYNMIPLPIPEAPGLILPPDTQLDSIDSRVNFLDLRGGVDYAINGDISVLADVQYLHYDIKDLATYGTVRFFAGGKFRLSEEFHLNLGASLDVEAQATASAGVVYLPSEHTAIALSYQYNAFPEVHQEFGRFSQVAISFKLDF